MKKYIILILAIVALASVAHAGLDVSGDTYTTLAVSTSVTNGTTTTTAVDVSSLKGGAKIILFDSGDLSNVSTQMLVTVQTSTTGTSAWSNVTAPLFTDIATNATVEAETLDTQTVSKYLRLSVTVDGATAVQHHIGAVIVSPR